MTRSETTTLRFLTTSCIFIEVVDAAPSKKRSRGGLNVFKYAGTVEEAAWNDEQQKRALQVRDIPFVATRLRLATCFI